MAAVLNSTLVGLFKTFYGRFAGTEGNLKTEVVDVNLLEVPHPQGVNKKVADRLLQSFQSMTIRKVGRLVEEALMDCHDPERAKAIAQGPVALSEELGQADRYALDEAVFELLGVSDSKRRKSLVERLHIETALHFRHIRVVEIQKMEQRAAATGGRRFRPDELATDAWDTLEGSDVVPVMKWLEDQAVSKTIARIPQERPAFLASSQHMFDAETVYFGKNKKVQVDCASRSHADLIILLAGLDISGDVPIPNSEKGCEKVRLALESRLEKACSKFEALASSRTSDDRLQTDVVNLLMHWYVHGRPSSVKVAAVPESSH